MQREGAFVNRSLWLKAAGIADNQQQPDFAIASMRLGSCPLRGGVASPASPRHRDPAFARLVPSTGRVNKCSSFAWVPGRFGEWCQAVTTRLVERVLGPADRAYANTLEEFLVPAIKAEAPHIVVCSQQIVGQFWAALAEANKPFIVALDHPRHALENLVVRHGIEFLEATRMVAKSCASVASCVALPGALVLHVDRDSVDLAATVAAIADHLGLPASDVDIADAVAAFADFDPCQDPQEYLAWWDQLDNAQRALVIGAIDPYIVRFAGGDLGPITWERDLFLINEDPPVEPNPPATRPIDVTGRPRYIVHGPYITLPPGSWSAIVALGFSAEAAEVSYIVDIGSETIRAQITFEPGEERVVEASLNFSLVTPEIVTIHVCNERAAFDGRLALGHVVLIPANTIRPETRSYLETALGT
jgi:hypothetical protein